MHSADFEADEGGPAEFTVITVLILSMLIMLLSR
jgi:hypothetical protein